MQKIITTILCLLFTHHLTHCISELREGISGYGTHFPVLATIVAQTTGPILEMGCGDYSTPMLHALCAPTKRMLVSTDASEEWLEFFLDMERDWHRFIYVPAYEPRHDANTIWFSISQYMWDNIGSDTHWSVVLIDHSPGLRRMFDIQRLRANTDIFVIHDTEDKRYRYDDVIRSFKYVYEYRRYHVTTTVVSDTIDVAKFFEL